MIDFNMGDWVVKAINALETGKHVRCMYYVAVIAFVFYVLVANMDKLAMFVQAVR